MKHCLYCLREFTGRGRCCSQWCARKVNGKTAWVTRSRNQARARVLEAEQRRKRHVPKFRQIAMGAEPGPLLAAIFGTEPDPAPHRHGEYLDAS